MPVCKVIFMDLIIFIILINQVNYFIFDQVINYIRQLDQLLYYNLTSYSCLKCPLLSGSWLLRVFKDASKFFDAFSFGSQGLYPLPLNPNDFFKQENIDLNSKAGPPKSIPLLFRSFEKLPLWMFPFGHSLEISFHTVGCPSHMERTYAYALVNSSIRAQFSSVQVPDMRVKKHPDVSKMKPQTWWSREKTSLLFPGQNLDLPTCEHNKILFVLYHLPRAALLNSHK